MALSHYSMLASAPNEEKNCYFLVTKIINVTDHCKDLTKFTACVTDKEQYYLAFRNEKDALKYVDSIIPYKDEGYPTKPNQSLTIYAPVLEVQLKNTDQLKSKNLNVKNFYTGNQTTLQSFNVTCDQITSISAISYKAGRGFLQKGEEIVSFHLNKIEFPADKTQEFLAGTLTNRRSCTIL